MTTFTSIPTANIEPDKPIRSIDGLALRDNPIAIAEGDPSAPKVRSKALQGPISGTTYLINPLQNAESGTTETSYMDGGMNRFADAGRHLGVLVLVAGTITCSAEHRSTSGQNGCWLRVLKNGVQQAEWVASTINVWFQRIVDIDVEVGDVVVFQLRSTFGADIRWRNLRIFSDNPDMAVA